MNESQLKTWLKEQSDDDFEIVARAVREERVTRMGDLEDVSDKTMKIIQALEAGEKVQGIATAHGVTRQWVYKVKKKYLVDKAA